MSENAPPPAKPRPKRPLEELRERRGGMTPALKTYFNEQQKIFKALKAALAKGPRTVPQLAQECGLPSPVVMWHVMAMRRYGEVLDGPEQDRHLLYILAGA
jgi:hypothetical protein